MTGEMTYWGGATDAHAACMDGCEGVGVNIFMLPAHPLTALSFSYQKFIYDRSGSPPPCCRAPR